MTRYEKFKTRSLEEMVKAIVEEDLTTEFCKSNCDDENATCPHPEECCLRWLNEEVRE